MKVFISSVQREFAEERKGLYQHLINDPFLSQYFEPLIFEEFPASIHDADKMFLEGVKNTDIYIVLIGKDYGSENEQGISATQLEFNQAMDNHTDTLAFIKDYPPNELHPKEKQFLNKVQKHVTYKRFNETHDLIQEINRAFVAYLQQKNLLLTTAFDATINSFATLADIDEQKIDDFLDIAIKKRNFPLRKGSSIEKVLTHLNLIDESKKIMNSALLLFSKNPQKFSPSAIVKCAHYHGFRVEKPIPNHQVIKNDVFTQADEAVDFVLSKIGVSVGTRVQSNQAEISYEIPRPVIVEAIVNAVAHRDYNSNGSIEIWLFRNRIEIRNPGCLPKELSIAKLEHDHSSYPFNPKLAEVLYQSGYIERFGTGTGEIFRLTKDAGLRKPEFDLNEGFKLTIWRPEITKDQVDIHDNIHDRIHDDMHDPLKLIFNKTDELAHRLVLVIQGDINRAQLMEKLNLKSRSSFVKNYLEPAISAGFIEMTIPDKPQSKKQRYILTKKGTKLKLKLRND